MNKRTLQLTYLVFSTVLIILLIMNFITTITAPDCGLKVGNVGRVHYSVYECGEEKTIKEGLSDFLEQDGGEK